MPEPSPSTERVSRRAGTLVGGVDLPQGGRHLLAVGGDAAHGDDEPRAVRD